jgi:hypothetical protein
MEKAWRFQVAQADADREPQEEGAGMTQDEIIEMAREAGCPDVYTEWAKSDWSSIKGLIVPMTLEQLVHCAKQVAAKEREACKALAKEYAAEYKEGGRLYPMLNGSITKTAATACDHIVYIIGERGQT